MMQLAENRRLHQHVRHLRQLLPVTIDDDAYKDRLTNACHDLLSGQLQSLKQVTSAVFPQRLHRKKHQKHIQNFYYQSYIPDMYETGLHFPSTENKAHRRGARAEKTCQMHVAKSLSFENDVLAQLDEMSRLEDDTERQTLKKAMDAVSIYSRSTAHIYAQLHAHESQLKACTARTLKTLYKDHFDLKTTIAQFERFHADATEAALTAKSIVTDAKTAGVWWQILREGSEWSRVKYSLPALDGKGLKGQPNPIDKPCVALWYKNGQPVMGAMWQDMGKVRCKFGWGGREYDARNDPIQSLAYNPKASQSADKKVAWVSYATSTTAGSGWSPVLVKHSGVDCAPCVIPGIDGKEYLGKVIVSEERASYPADGKEIEVFGPAVQKFMVLSKKI